jgi:hypothetical protein
VRLDHDRVWHIERGHLWRDLVDRGLRRCPFGVESGATSILERFNKETTGLGAQLTSPVIGKFLMDNAGTPRVR